MDLTKAFDLLNHSLLLEKLHSYGVRDIPLSLIKSYLTDRMQYVVANGEPSRMLKTNIGVPQGSILGPFLFLVFVNDLPSYLIEDCILYADDTNIFITSKNESTLYKTAEVILQKLSLWLHTNKLVPNTSKSNYMVFSAKNKTLTNNYNLCLNNELLQRVQNTKFLGVTLDNQLTWKIHVQLLCAKIYKNMPILYKLRHIFPLKTLLAIYNCFVHCHIQYATAVYGLTYRTTLLPVQTAQNTALRIILFLRKRDSVQFAYPLLNILSVHQSIKHRISMITFKILKNLSCCPVIKLEYRSTRCITRSQAQQLQVPRARTNYGLFSFSYTATKL